MKKKRKNREAVGVTNTPQATRDFLKIATRMALQRHPVRLPSKPLAQDLRIVEDRRTIPHDIRETQYRDISGTPAQISRGPARTAQRKMQGLLPPLYNRFLHPERVPVCVRRATRRRVLHALRRTGRGFARPRWTAKSYIRCK